jgi:wyosine [tRNA(Phe)-imidazoG37] synthetase (radical SAM superfamily)
MKVENNIQKLDTVSTEYIRRVDRPTSMAYNVGKVIENLRKFNGHVIIQTMFMKGTTGGLHPESVDNTGEEYVKPWLDAVKRIAPGQVMIYTIDRETPTSGLLKATPQQLDSIRDRVIAAGIPCSASY